MNHLAFILLLLAVTTSATEPPPGCFFPESEVRPFFYEVESDVPVGTSIADSVVDPLGSEMMLASVRSDLFPNINYTSKLDVSVSKRTGRFHLRNIEKLALPAYPSKHEEMFLYVTVICNQQAYPLLTLHVNAANTVPPQFYGLPYTIPVDKDLYIGSTFDIPVVAIDWDPSEVYNVTYSLLNQDSLELIETEERFLPANVEDGHLWSEQQKPRKLQLKVKKQLKLPMKVTIMAQDHGLPPKNSTTVVKLVLNNKKEDSPRAFSSKSLPQLPVKIAKEQLEQLSSSSEPPAFAKCHQMVSLMENSPNGTFVAHFDVNNRESDTTIRLTDPDGTFNLSQEGDLTIANNRIIDREFFSSIEVVVEIENAHRNSECSRTRLRIDIEDENDNRPVFEKEKYWFHLASKVPSNTEFGILRARDVDDHINGLVKYRLLNTSVPFRLFPRGRDTALLTNGPIDGPEIYHLLVEARDSGIPQKTTTVAVDVFVLTTPISASDEDDVKRLVTSSDKKKVVEGVVNTAIEQAIEVKQIDNLQASKNPVTTSRPRQVDLDRQSISDDDDDVQQHHQQQQQQQHQQQPQQGREEVEEETEQLDKEEVLENINNDNFTFTASFYYYEVFGDPIEDDVVGRVVAEPDVQMYGLDRKMAGIFKIDADIGEISVGKDLYRQPNGNYTFKASATNGVHTAKTTVTVLLDQSRAKSDGAPRFDQTLYKFRVVENTPPEVIGIVRAFHISTSIRSSPNRLRYDIVSDDADLPFSVHQLSGEVANERELDFEFKANYQFKIRACLSDNISQCGISTVLVSVEDVNDNNPRFSSSLEHVTIPSDAPVGTDVVRVKALDADSGSNGIVNYAITPPSAVFAIDLDTGKVITIAPLLQSRYSILIEAFDNGIPRRTDVTEVRITVQGTNPSSPIFDKKTYEVSLTSPVRAGSVVARLRASDPDPGPEGKVKYRFEQTNNPAILHILNKLEINENTGVVSAIQPLSALEGPFDVIIEATDESSAFARKTSALLHVDISGGTALRFLPLPVAIFISTEKAIGSVVLRASAITNGPSPVQFSILEDNSPFIMDGDLLRVAAHLLPGKHLLTVRAESEGAHIDHQLTVNVITDKDKFPVFPQLTYDFDIPQNAHFPMTIHRFNAVLQNGRFSYELFPDGQAPKGLVLDSSSGELIVTSDYVKEPDNQATVFTVVRARNIQFPKFYSDVGVALSLVSRRAPGRFSQAFYSFEVKENTPIGTIIGTPVEVFPKDGSTSYRLLPDSWFGIHNNGSLFVKKNLDLESLPVDSNSLITFVVSAETSTGRTTSKIQLHVLDENEFGPIMAPTVSGNIAEDAPSGSVILKVNATDGDFTEGSHLLYKIVGGSGRSLVFIQEDGTLILADRPLGRSQMKEFDVIIEAIDKGGNKAVSKAHIIVKASRTRRPVVKNLPIVWNVTEEALASSIVLETEDSEDSFIRFSIIQGNEAGYFRLVTDGANKASLHLVRPLDYEASKESLLTLEAKDARNPSQPTIFPVKINVINVNDNPPMFKNKTYSQKVPMDLPIGFPIITVSADDLDEDIVRYSLHGAGCDVFSIDPTGVISFNVPTSKRPEQELTCVVEASDGLHMSQTTVSLDVYSATQPTKPSSTNRAPVFGQQSYNFVLLPESTEDIGKVSASDPDGDQVLFSIRPAEYRNLFDVDSEGVISLKVDMKELSQTSYNFLVNAEDWGPPIMTAVANVHIHIPEELSTTSAAVDEFSAATMDLVEGDRTTTTSTRTPSTILVKGGRTTPSTPTTFSTRSATRFTVKPTPAPIIKFIRPSYMFSVRDDAPIGTYLGSVHLTYSRDVTLQFAKENIFNISPNGSIKTSRLLSSNIERVEDVIEAVRNNVVVATVPFIVHLIKTPSETSSEEVPFTTISSMNAIEDTTPSSDDETFHFLRPMYFAFVPEGKYSNGIKVSVKPQELSTNYNGPVTYAIQETDKMPFFVTAEGQLIVFDVDREVKDNYMITIVARTSENIARRAVSSINVTVLDVNDNYPVFDEHPQTLGLYRDASIGSTVYRFKATDSDADDSGVVVYELDQEAQLWLAIDSNEGTLTVAHVLDKAPSDMTLVVTARDKGRPSLRTHHKISLRIFDPHNPVPTLPRNVDVIRVPENSSENSLLATLLAGPDSDRQGYENIDYHLTEDFGDLFKILDGGKLVLNRRPFSNELGRVFQLNVSAENSLGVDTTIVNVLIEGKVESSTMKIMQESACGLKKKVIKTEIKENVKERTLLATVKSPCPHVQYELDENNDYFEVDPQSGDIYAVRPLDRETQSMHFLYVNVVPKSRQRRENPAIEDAQSRLKPDQALVVVHVIDENDNAPEFVHVFDNNIVANINWQASVGTPVVRIQAKDIDERSHLTYSLSGDGSDVFSINNTLGLVVLSNSITEDSRSKYQMTVSVSDGLHSSTIPLMIYKLSPSANIVRLTSEVPMNQLKEYQIEKTVNELTESDSRVVSKQVFVDEHGKEDKQRSHVFVYSVDQKTKEPIRREKLVDLLMSQSSSLLASPSRISEVSMVSDGDSVLSAGDVLLLLLALVIVSLLLLCCCWLAAFCQKRRYDHVGSSKESGYMVDSVGAGPRPYDVEKISRHTAQTVLASRVLPNPHEHQIDSTVSPAFEENVSSNNTIYTKEFSNSVRERPSLLQSALSRHTNNRDNSLTVSVDVIDERNNKQH